MIRESTFTNGDIACFKDRIHEVRQAVRDNFLLLPGDRTPLQVPPSESGTIICLP